MQNQAECEVTGGVGLLTDSLSPNCRSWGEVMEAGGFTPELHTAWERSRLGDAESRECC